MKRARSHYGKCGGISVVLISHTASCLLMLSMIHITPQLLSAIFPNMPYWSISGGIYIIIIIMHIAFVVYFYVSRKYSVFALPISHIVFPFIFYCAMFLLWRFTHLWKAFETPWVGFVILVSFYYFLPIAVITSIISSIISLIIKLKQ